MFDPIQTPEVEQEIAKAVIQADHKRRHIALHDSLYELVADFIRHTDQRPSQATVLELLQWSKQQTESPTEL